MVDVYEVHSTAKICWIKRLLSETSGKWKDLMWSRLDMNIDLTNENINIKLRKPKTKFHQQILNSWHRIHNKHPTNTIHILNQYI